MTEVKLNSQNYDRIDISPFFFSNLGQNGWAN